MVDIVTRARHVVEDALDTVVEDGDFVCSNQVIADIVVQALLDAKILKDDSNA